MKKKKKKKRIKHKTTNQLLDQPKQPTSELIKQLFKSAKSLLFLNLKLTTDSMKKKTLT